MYTGGIRTFIRPIRGMLLARGTSTRDPTRPTALRGGFPWSTRVSEVGCVWIGHSTSSWWRTTPRSEMVLLSKGIRAHESTRRPRGRCTRTPLSETTTRAPSPRSLGGSGHTPRAASICIAWCSLRPTPRRRSSFFRHRPPVPASDRKISGTG